MTDKIEMCREFFDECLRDAYEWGYCDGQNNPNGYSNTKDRDACMRHLTTLIDNQSPKTVRVHDDEPHS